MIGNDIVDFNLATKQSDWQRPRYLDKLFTAEEQNMIYAAKNPSKALWRLWSMKESAYKVHVQEYGERFFAPKKITCEWLGNTAGLVTIGDHYYTSESLQADHYVFSTALPEECKTNFSTHFFAINHLSEQTESEQAYHALKMHLSGQYQFSYETLSIQKSVSGVPLVFQKNKRLDISFSITHHGRFAAISILNS